MCGRYALGLQRAEIRALPGYPNLEIGEWVNEDNFVPRYNIAPNSLAPVIRRRNSFSPDLQMQTMRWGIPYGKVHAKNQQAINARSENILEGAGMWNKYRSSNRCIVVSQGCALIIQDGLGTNLPPGTMSGRQRPRPSFPTSRNMLMGR
jgi:putative SOS response-associated peptidase YedK